MREEAKLNVEMKKRQKEIERQVQRDSMSQPGSKSGVSL
jgi:hypothetical protein